jgi:phospholipid/cholesterol/gamma-HCH transport system substrate-binding protein
MVTIGVDPVTPVRKDTKAGIEFQGLTGSPAVSLKGGASDPLLPSHSGELPILIAERDAGQNMTEAARATLRRLDTIMADNADPLRNTMVNLSKFSEALGRNSDRVDGVMAWLDRLSGGAKTAGVTYDLVAPRESQQAVSPPDLLISIPEPTITYALSQDKILIREQGTLRPLTGEPRWSDMLANLIQTRVIQSFENANLLGRISRPADGVAGAHQLALDVRSFEVAAEPQLAAVVDVSARILSADGRAIGARTFDVRLPVEGSEGANAAGALAKAFATVASELVAWTLTVVEEQK